MFSIQVTTDVDVLEKWTSLPQRFKAALAAKMDILAKALEDKVIENLSGKVLQTKSGQLVRSIHREVHVSEYEIIAFVGPIPTSPKAYVQEFGGKGAYLIQVGSKGVLANRETGFFSKHDVIHPPLPERSYLRSALLEIAPEVPIELIAGIDHVMR